MGYGMAVNLRSKMDKNQTLYICDTSEEAIKKFQSEMSGHGPIQVVENGAEAVDHTVGQRLGLIRQPDSTDSNARTLFSQCYRTVQQ